MLNLFKLKINYKKVLIKAIIFCRKPYFYFIYNIKMKLELKYWLLLIFISIIWGSSFMLMKRGMHTAEGIEIFSNMQVGAIRMTLAGLVLLPVGIYNFNKVKNLKTFFSILAVGLFGNFIPAFLFTYAETGLSTGYTGMLNSFTPVFTIIIGGIFFKNKLTQTQFTGLIISIVGVALLIKTGNSEQQSTSPSEWTHLAAVVGATFCYAVSLNIIKNLLSDINAIHTTSIAFSLTLIPALFFIWKTETINTIQTNNYAINGLIPIAILAIVGTAFAVMLFNNLTLNTTTLFASSVTYLIPIVAVIIGSGFGESISTYQVLSMLIALSGIFVANRKNIKLKIEL